MLIDPTSKAINHFAEVKQLFTGGIQKDYYSRIHLSRPNFDRFQYINSGLWNKMDELNFINRQMIIMCHIR